MRAGLGRNCWEDSRTGAAQFSQNLFFFLKYYRCSGMDGCKGKCQSRNEVSQDRKGSRRARASCVRGRWTPGLRHPGNWSSGELICGKVLSGKWFEAAQQLAVQGFPSTQQFAVQGPVPVHNLFSEFSESSKCHLLFF